MNTHRREVPFDCPFVGMTRILNKPISTRYDGPAHVPAMPQSQRGYMPSAALLRKTGFVEVRGFTGWLRRDEARPIGYFYLQGRRTPTPNFQKIACWGRFTSTADRTEDDWRLFDDIDFKDKLRVAAPQNDAEFLALVAHFSPVRVFRNRQLPMRARLRTRLRARLATAKAWVDEGRWWGLMVGAVGRGGG